MKNSKKSDAAVERAYRVMAQSGIVETLERCGCRVNVIGSVAMGLIASHMDIDLHVYSKGVTTAGSFAIMAEIADNPDVTEIICINGLHTDERCIAWHINYRCSDGEMWKFDIIHIEEGSRYDGFFEKNGRTNQRPDYTGIEGTDTGIEVFDSRRYENKRCGILRGGDCRRSKDSPRTV